ncbi:MAG: aspartate aminotransferase family protein [Candidatus Hecatellaceae archaeon]
MEWEVPPEELMELEKTYIMPCVKKLVPKVFVEGRGAILKDVEGREYIDAYAGVAVVNTGHCRPEIVKAVAEQTSKLIHSSTLYYTYPPVMLAKRLSEIAPMDRGKPKKTFFCNSGGEAVEGAYFLAKKYTGKFEVIALQRSFHGRSLAAMSFTGQVKWKLRAGPAMSGVHFAPAFYCYRCPLGHKEGPPKCSYACALYLREIFNTQTTGQVAAFIAEPILGNGGAVVAPPEYFKIVKEILDEQGVLFICDEIQTGFGRTGKMFAIEHYGVEPDIVTLAKAIAAGLPLGAFIARKHIADALAPGEHFSTFGGNLVSCTAALVNLDILLKENLMANAERVGGYLLKRFSETMDAHPLVGDVRGKGLMIGVELVKDRLSKKPAVEEAEKLVFEAMKRGVLLGIGGVEGNVIRVKPPLVITLEQAERVAEVLDESLKAVEREAL